jgi:hypothetical protein
MADITNFDPNNYQAFYEAALKQWESILNNIKWQTTELAKWSAMEQVRDQWFALWQASKYWDTESYKQKIMSDIEQKSELERSKTLAEQYAKEQSASANQQNLLSSIGSALLQMKIAKESWWSSWGGGGSYPSSQNMEEILKKMWIWYEAWTEEDDKKSTDDKKEKWFWKWADYIAPALTWAWAVALAIPWWQVVAPWLLWWGRALSAADAARSIAKWNMWQAVFEATNIIPWTWKIGGKLATKLIPGSVKKTATTQLEKILKNSSRWKKLFYK